MRPVILSSPAKVATGWAIGCAWAEMAARGARMAASNSDRQHAGRRKDKPTAPLFRRPGLIVAGHPRTLALVEQAAIGAIGLGGAGQVGLVRQFPGIRLVAGFGRHHIGAVMYPAVPARRDGGGVGIAARIGDVAAIGLAVLVIAITELV